jgi:hypothetical protein
MSSNFDKKNLIPRLNIILIFNDYFNQNGIEY